MIVISRLVYQYSGNSFRCLETLLHQRPLDKPSGKSSSLKKSSPRSILHEAAPPEDQCVSIIQHTQILHLPAEPDAGRTCQNRSFLSSTYCKLKATIFVTVMKCKRILEVIVQHKSEHYM